MPRPLLKHCGVDSGATHAGILATRLIHRSHAEPDRYLYATARALVDAAPPSPDRPDGAVIATAAPAEWKGRRVRVLDLGP